MVVRSDDVDMAVLGLDERRQHAGEVRDCVESSVVDAEPGRVDPGMEHHGGCIVVAGRNVHREEAQSCGVALWLHHARKAALAQRGSELRGQSFALFVASKDEDCLGRVEGCFSGLSEPPQDAQSCREGGYESQPGCCADDWQQPVFASTCQP